VAQTRRKRQTKHRGNAAGVVESRGRTGRKPTAAEKSGSPRDVARAKEEKLLDKRDRPPTWRAAFTKAMFAAVVLLLVVIVLLHQKSNGAIELFPIVLVMYTLVSFYTDKWVYDRRQRKKAREGGGKAPSR
jgi:Flp pilus assembly protein TadB